MFYSPKQDKKAIITSIVVIILSVLIVSLSGLFPGWSGVINIAGMAVLTGATFVTVRYSIYKYAYQITSTDLIVTRTAYKRTQTVAVLALSEGVGVYKRPKNAKEKSEIPDEMKKTDGRMNFCQNLFAEPYVFTTRFNGRLIEILIEADEEFARALKEASDRAREEAEDEQ